MDLPDPIGWQLERKQRENGREKSRRKLVRQRQPSLEVAGGDEGMGKGSGREERDEKGKVEGKKLEMGRGQSFMGAWGKAGGSPQPATHAILSHNTRQCTHSSRHVLSPSDIPLIRTSEITFTVHHNNPRESPHLNHLHMIKSTKSLLPFKVTCTHSRDLSMSISGAIIQPTISCKKEFQRLFH